MKSLEDLAQIERSNRLGEFAQLCRLIMLGKGFPKNAPEAAKARISPRVAEIIRAAVPPGGAYGAGSWGEQLDGTRLILAAFSDSLRHSSAWAAAVNASLIWRVPLGEAVGLVAASAGNAAVVGPADAAPVHRLDVSGAIVAREAADGVVVLSNELLRDAPATAEAVIVRELRRAVGVGIDAAAMTTLTAGVSPHTALATPLDDARTLIQDVDPTPMSRPFWVAGATAAQLIATSHTDGVRHAPDVNPATGGTWFGWPFFVSAGLNPGLLLLCDGARLAGNLADAEVGLARSATVAMDDTSVGGMAGSPGTLTGLDTTNLVSLWQQDLAGLRALQWFGCARLANGAVAAVSYAGSP